VRKNITLDRSSVTDDWPLIRYLLDDLVYWGRYMAFLAKNYATLLAPDRLTARIHGYAKVIAPVATQDMSPEDYAATVQAIVDFVTTRAVDVRAFLAKWEQLGRQAHQDATQPTQDA
jgi:hypothetical protein